MEIIAAGTGVLIGLWMIYAFAKWLFGLGQKVSSFAASTGKPKVPKLSALDQQLASIPDFNPALQFRERFGDRALVLDPERERWAVLNSNLPSRVYEFAQLVAVEIEKDGETVQKTNRGSQIAGAAVGGVLLGGVGVLLGGLSGSKREVATVQRLALKLYTTDLVNPVTTITFFYSTKGLKPSDDSVTRAAAELEKWYARFKTILLANEREASAFSRPSQPSQTRLLD